MKRQAPGADQSTPVVIEAGELDTAVIELPATTEPSIQLTAGRRRAIFVTLALALLMTSIDQTIVASALTAIQSDLGTGLEWSTWTITVYALGQVLMMPLAGRLADVFGRRRVFIAAAVVFTVATIAAGFSPNIYVLVAMRALQSIGGGAFVPSASGIVVEIFGKNRDRALGLFITAFPLGGIIGPVLGGLIVGVATWRDIFFVTAPVGVLLVVLSIVLLPKFRSGVGQRIDVLGTLLLGLSLLGGMLGVTSLGNSAVGPLDLRFLIPAAIGLVAGGLFIWRISVARHRSCRPRLLWGKTFGILNALNIFYGAAALGISALIPFYAQAAFDVPALQSGSLLSARAVGMIAVAALATFALRRTGYRLPMIVGLSPGCLGAVAMAIVPEWASPYLWLFIAMAIGGIGTGFLVPSSNNAGLQLEPQNAAGHRRTSRHVPECRLDSRGVAGERGRRPQR